MKRASYFGRPSKNDGRSAHDKITGSNMIGRQQQLDRIFDALGALFAGAAPNVLFVTGEAGIGKTTILRRVAELLAVRNSEARTLARYGSTEESDVSVIAVSTECSTPLAGRDIGEAESLNPWANLMAQLLEHSARETVEKKKTKFDFGKFLVDTAPAWVTMVPVLGPSVGAALDIVGATYDQYYFNRKLAKESSGQNAANQQQVFQQYINFLTSACERQPLVLMIDDFHWADTSSANLLFAAARALQGKPVAFVIAYRPDDAATSRAGEGHPVLHIRNELERYGLCVDLGIPRLTTADLDALLRERYPAYRNNSHFEEWLARTGGGNALFITQFLATLEEDGYITKESGSIREGFEKTGVPASAQAVVQERIRRLNEDMRELLRYASVEGDIFTTAVLAKITETPLLKLLQRLRLVEEAHKFVLSLGKQKVYAHETTAYQFAHALLHKVLYESLGEEERELLHEAVFGIVREEWQAAKEEHVNLEGIAARLAVHADILGQHLFAAEVLLEGAEASWREFAGEETLHLLRNVHSALDKAEQQSVGREKVRMVRGRAYIFQARIELLRGKAEASLQQIQQALAVLDKVNDTLALYYEARAVEIEALRTGGSYEMAEARAQDLLHHTHNTGHVEAETSALNELGVLMYIQARYPEALELLQQSITLLPPHSREKLARGTNNIGLILVAMGKFDEALLYFERSIEHYRAAHSRIGQGTYFNNIGLIQYQLGRYDEAMKSFEASLALRQSTGDRPGAATSLHNLGLVYMVIGQPDRAAEYFRESLEMTRDLHLPMLIARLLLNIGSIERNRGNTTLAIDYYRRSLLTARQDKNPEGTAVALLNLGALLREMGTYDESSILLAEALELSRSIGQKEYEGSSFGELVLIRQATTTPANPEQQRALLAQNVAELRTCVELLQESHSMETDKWKTELAAAEQELAILEAGSL